MNVLNKCSHNNIYVDPSHEGLFIQRLEELLGILREEAA